MQLSIQIIQQTITNLREKLLSTSVIEESAPVVDHSLHKLKEELEADLVEKDRLLLEQEQQLLALTDRVSELQ